ncbi:MAG: hypothetical protein A3I77_01395 [Gammaproteobacteria bacterium RIFCSPLOWO2_02_FULL_42_14]|nr:MAG: hypothetical protein A3B71_07580 [Gammaproteobacteria bacterium RIFCSPHIGHO2_02_FULL_42_43]OGT29209.1 MAG: hypothetical protein A2624_07155 [Gammaproteobacteria bacterium RIFCSPHIGHO2_01_FULL_42_8]OGT52282.1 MAG: hypothetical protein A3E54_01455 [Gammaproteobacteria bacterium RIFCSPHIGHO2_12_FULL_41_25]OGT61895.1 MAG: hypothetical protein A3I77_01395 [Gammaproteobacteria bacterium RIFCSPLOWO2_02_FULL_42_14]OGT86395.1 MAG: hypothetical protein A3G86_07700 [Gammaproteobacteria bacterium R
MEFDWLAMGNTSKHKAGLGEGLFKLTAPKIRTQRYNTMLVLPWTFLLQFIGENENLLYDHDTYTRNKIRGSLHVEFSFYYGRCISYVG